MAKRNGVAAAVAAALSPATVAAKLAAVAAAKTAADTTLGSVKERAAFVKSGMSDIRRAIGEATDRAASVWNLILSFHLSGVSWEEMKTADAETYGLSTFRVYKSHIVRAELSGAELSPDMSHVEVQELAGSKTAKKRGARTTKGEGAEEAAADSAPASVPGLSFLTKADMLKAACAAFTESASLRQDFSGELANIAHLLAADRATAIKTAALAVARDKAKAAKHAADKRAAADARRDLAAEYATVEPLGMKIAA